jgi:monoterpene epsilon-lactone hydrolase
MPSILSRLIRGLIQVNKPKGKIKKKPVEQLRQEFETDMSRYKLPPDVTIEKVSVGKINCEWVIPPNVDSSRTLYYIHGGGFYAGSLNTHRVAVANFASSMGIRAFHIDYRRAPEYPFPAAVEDCVSVYKWLIKHDVSPKSIIIGGESAGATLTLNTLITCRDQGIELPVGAFCLCPLTDFAFKSESLITHAESELFYTFEELEWVRQIYAGDHDPKGPNLSPVYADLNGLPPLLIHTTDQEMLCDDAIRLNIKAQTDGVNTELKVWNGLFHGFQLLPFLPESKIALEDLSSFSQRVFHASS